MNGRPSCTPLRGSARRRPTRRFDDSSVPIAQRMFQSPPTSTRASFQNRLRGHQHYLTASDFLAHNIVFDRRNRDSTPGYLLPLDTLWSQLHCPPCDTPPSISMDTHPVTCPNCGLQREVKRLPCPWCRCFAMRFGRSNLAQRSHNMVFTLGLRHTFALWQRSPTLVQFP